MKLCSSIKIVIILLLTIFCVFPSFAYQNDNISKLVSSAINHNPSIPTIQTNSGHTAKMIAISCDGKYIFGANTSELSIRERNSLRLIKSFPIKGISEIIPDLIDSDLIILNLGPFTYKWNGAFPPPSIIINWKNGQIIGHVNKSLLPKQLNCINENFLWNNNYGYVAYRNIKAFTGNGYNYYRQGTLDVNKNDSLIVISSMTPLVWDLKHAKTVSFIPLSSWIMNNDTTLNHDDVLSMLPKPKKWKWKNNSSIFNRNIFSARFTDDNSIKMGGPTPFITEWTTDGLLIDSVKLPLNEGIIFDFSTNNGKIVTATSDGFFLIRNDKSIIRLDILSGDHSDLPNVRKGVANIVSGSFGENYFLSSLCGAGNDPIVKIGSFNDDFVIKCLNDKSWGEIIDVKISKNKKIALATNSFSIAELYLDKKDEIPINVIKVPTDGYDGGDFLNAVEILPDGKYLVGTAFGDLKLYNNKKKSWSFLTKMHIHSVQSLILSHDETKLFSTDSGNTTVIWDVKTLQPILSLKNFWPYGLISFTPDGFYSYENIGVSLGTFAHISKDNRTYSIDQFDLTNNRPDIIAERLGAGKEYITKLNKAWRKRIRRNGFDPDKIMSGFHTPEIEIVNKDQISLNTKQDTINIKVKVFDDSRFIQGVIIKNNGVPVSSQKDLNIHKSKIGFSQIVDLCVALKEGINNISIQCVNDQGAKSLADEISINKKSDIKGNNTLWIVAAGVSEYHNSDYRLAFASKDAIDFSDMLSKTVNTFEKVKTLTLTDTDFSQASVAKIRDFIADASIDDAVIIFYAGHGVLDSNLDYFLAPVDMDFSNPSANGVAVSDITNILENAKPLVRYVIIDACHSGMIDKEDYLAEASLQTDDVSNIKFRSVGNIKHKSNEALEISSLASDIFEELNTAAGITYISSASGNEVAVESELWQNGLFTNAIKQALNIDENTGLPKSCNSRENLTLEDVYDYAQKKVREISNNSQNPRKVSNFYSEKLNIYKSKN